MVMDKFRSPVQIWLRRVLIYIPVMLLAAMMIIPYYWMVTGAFKPVAELKKVPPTLTIENPIGLYIDGVYISRTSGDTISVLDLERVEILRGPQGTLFGRNSSAGAVNFISKKPAEEFGGKFELGTGNYGLVRGYGSLDIPMTDTFRLKLSAAASSQAARKAARWRGEPKRRWSSAAAKTTPQRRTPLEKLLLASTAATRQTANFAAWPRREPSATTASTSAKGGITKEVWMA